MVTEPPTLPLPGMCAVDVDDVAHSITEFMIQMPRQLGTHRADIASTTVFIDGHPVLARAVRDRIIEFTTDPQQARRVTNAAAVEGFFRGEYYFAYDFFMDQGLATTRLPSAIWIGPAVLHDYELARDGGAARWPGRAVRPPAGEVKPSRSGRAEPARTISSVPPGGRLRGARPRRRRGSPARHRRGTRCAPVLRHHRAARNGTPWKRRQLGVRGS